ncbi:hypothetical protein [Xenorhabdus bovienii]|uniref:hypothetical protein n=1 Tax=Xenorhabdus bovienii TaxID=40576 RepID=UPI003DA443FB
MGKRRNKTQQGYAGMTIPQLFRLKENSITEYENSKRFIAPYSIGDEVLIPLNRAMRRHAKKKGIKLEEVNNG